MNNYVTGSIVAFVLMAMGLSSMLAGAYNAYENRKSKSGKLMFGIVFLCFPMGFRLCMDEHVL